MGNTKCITEGHDWSDWTFSTVLNAKERHCKMKGCDGFERVRPVKVIDPIDLDSPWCPATGNNVEHDWAFVPKDGSRRCMACGVVWTYRENFDREKEKPEHDPVNHPSHYTQYKGLEIIDLTEQMNFNLGNAVKYIARAGHKDPDKTVEDLQKAIWYAEREIKRLTT